MERSVYPGEFYRHFKNKLYQIVAVAVHSETGEKMVVYQALYGDFGVYVRPYEMFVSEVDHEKYPGVSQKYRFERVQPGEAIAPDTKNVRVPAPENEGGHKEDAEKNFCPPPAFLKFLETDDFAVRMECLKAMEQTVTQQELDSIYVVLDMKPESGSVKAQVGAIRRFLAMQEHFKGKRLR